MKKTFKKSFAVLTALLMLCCMLPVGVFAEGDIPIDEAHFPDANFRNFVLTGSDDETGVKIDTDSSGALSPEEIAAVTYINVGNMEIADLTGIEYFTALEGLNCDANQLTHLDVSKNTALTWLECSYNKLSVLDISKNTALTDLGCDNNQLTALDVSKNTALTDLGCDNNQLTQLDVSDNTAIEILFCSGNQLTSLDVSINTALEMLGCHWNRLTELDVSKNTALRTLWCHANQLTSLDVSKNTALTVLDCYDNQLTSLDVSNNTALEYLHCSDNQLTSLDVSNNTALEYLHCNDNQYKVFSNPFNLTELPGNFDVTKASNWQGATINGTILTFTAGFATYTYDCGNGLSAEFKLLSPDYVETVPGDYDGNGKVTTQDALMILRSAMGLIPEEAPDAADVDGNGIVNTQDALLALRMAMGLV